VHARVAKLRELERTVKSGEADQMPKKEGLRVRRELAKLERNLGGIRNLEKLPDVVFVIDTKKEHIAVTEANRLNIPVVAVVDTNCDPDVIDYVIPGNDDAIRAANLMCRVIADAVEEGVQLARRKGARPATRSEDVVAPPLDPEEQRRKAEAQRRAQAEAREAQRVREERLLAQAAEGKESATVGAGTGGDATESTETSGGETAPSEASNG
jgi:small subunit ribosomal protein S2